MEAGNGAPESGDRRALDVLLAEHRTLRDEVLSRMGLQSQAFSYCAIITSAALAGIFSLVRNGMDVLNAVPAVAMILPLLTTPLAFIFFDHELMIMAIGFYLHDVWRRQVWQAAGNTELFAERRFDQLLDGSKASHRQVSTGRWLFFWLPPVLGLAAGIYFLIAHAGSRALVLVGIAIVLVTDAILTIVLTRAIYQAYREQTRWRGEPLRK